MRRKSEFCEVQVSCGWASYCPTQRRSSLPDLSVLRMALWLWFSPFTTFPHILALQCSGWDCLAGKACWLRGATYKKSQSILQWLKRWIPPRFLFLSPNPKPFLFLSLFSHFIYPDSKSQIVWGNLISSNLSHDLLTCHAFWFLGQKVWSPPMTSSNYPLLFLSLSLCLLIYQVGHYKPTHKYEQK